jgi:hypothetical protein
MIQQSLVGRFARSLFIRALFEVFEIYVHPVSVRRKQTNTKTRSIPIEQEARRDAWSDSNESSP